MYLERGGVRTFKMQDKTDRRGALDAALKGMFRALKGRATPDKLRSVVDQLDEGDKRPDRKRA
jgi:hypothetical protein